MYTRNNVELPSRRSVRLKKWDYSNSGWYYLTLCTYKRALLFGNIVRATRGMTDFPTVHMQLNTIGKIVEGIWLSTPRHHDIVLDDYIIMPNHIHCIIQIVGATRGSPETTTRGSPYINVDGSRPNDGDTTGSMVKDKGGSRPAPTSKTSNTTSKRPTLGNIVGLFKSECTKSIRRQLHRPDLALWQRNYYEYIIRNEKDLFRIR